jgi:hypothetical protein
VGIPENLHVELLVEEVAPESHDALPVGPELFCSFVSTPDCETSADLLSPALQVVSANLVFNCCNFLFKNTASVPVRSFGASQSARHVTKL